MRLESLHIERNTHSFDYAGLRPQEVGGSIKFSGPGGSTVQLRLKPAQVDQILRIVADAMVEQTRALATELTAQVIEGARLPALTAEAA